MYEWYVWVRPFAPAAAAGGICCCCCAELTIPASSRLVALTPSTSHFPAMDTIKKTADSTLTRAMKQRGPQQQSQGVATLLTPCLHLLLLVSPFCSPQPSPRASRCAHKNSHAAECGDATAQQTVAPGSRPAAVLACRTRCSFPPVVCLLLQDTVTAVGDKLTGQTHTPTKAHEQPTAITGSSGTTTSSDIGGKARPQAAAAPAADPGKASLLQHMCMHSACLLLTTRVCVRRVCVCTTLPLMMSPPSRRPAKCRRSAAQCTSDTLRSISLSWLSLDISS